MGPEVFCRWCGQKMSLVMHKDQDGFGDSICVNAGRVLDGVTSTKKEISLCCARMWQRERFRFRDIFGDKKGV